MQQKCGVNGIISQTLFYLPTYIAPILRARRPHAVEGTEVAEGGRDEGLDGAVIDGIRDLAGVATVRGRKNRKEKVREIDYFGGSGMSAPGGRC